MRHTMLKRLGIGLLGAAAALGTVAAPGASAGAGPSTCPTKPAPVRIATGQAFGAGQRLTSGDTALTMQSDGNLVQYLVRPDCQNGPVLWASNTYGNPGAYAIMQSDGNFVVYRAGGAGALWSSGTWNQSGATASLDGGALRVHNGTGVSWQDVSGYLPAHDADNNPLPQVSSRLQPGFQMGNGSWAESGSVWLVQQNDGNLVLYRKRDGAALWSTNTWGHPGAHTDVTSAGRLEVAQNGSQVWAEGAPPVPGSYLQVQDDANVVLYRPNATSSADALWSTGTYGKG
ncbi:hypothetical protein LN042_27700 [Kitasatospora sp. RB6PN24]|uniref:hypothetical protein n=1 Tax=Kitasatospora humi TaxID=2893891 RepID=UPI001E3EF2D3|nr:hypothetical protein [Kitasatospora humi]MCC9310810.1 hypothetical protein [Kitasatospora humi]